jgi:hypothetical protein
MLFFADVTSQEAAIIENELRSVLTTFVVSDYEDLRLLQAMISKVRPTNFVSQEHQQ